MELTSNCKVLLQKGNTQKVACCKFSYEVLNRELAIHEDVDSKNRTTITDIKTGLRMCGLDKPIDKVKIEDVLARLDMLLKHFTLPEILKEFKRIEEDLAC